MMLGMKVIHSGGATRKMAMVIIQIVAKIVAKKNQAERKRSPFDEPKKTAAPESNVKTETVISKMAINST